MGSESATRCVFFVLRAFLNLFCSFLACFGPPLGPRLCQNVAIKPSFISTKYQPNPMHGNPIYEQFHVHSFVLFLFCVLFFVFVFVVCFVFCFLFLFLFVVLFRLFSFSFSFFLLFVSPPFCFF